MTPSQISAKLNEQIETVCRHLLPGGRRKQFDWVAGSVSGEKGDSLKVRINGEKVGVWSDFATGESGGDMLDLWCATRGVNLRTAMAEASSLLGLAMDGEDSRPRREWRKPPKPKCERVRETSVAMAWLKARGFTEQTVEDYRLAETAEREIVFPYLRCDGSFANAKYRGLPKRFRQESGAEPCLFGWHVIESHYPNSRRVTICEGECDCLALHQIGIPALSVPNGGGGGHKQDWIDADYDELQRFDVVYLCLDADEPGRQATEEIMRRMGVERCRIVDLPHQHKDANEWLLAGMTKEDFERRLAKARTRDPDDLKPAGYFRDKVLRLFREEDSDQPPVGSACPWPSLHRSLRFRDGEITLWAGYNGHGKSAIISNVMARSLSDGGAWCVASMEMTGERTLQRLIRQMLALHRPTDERIESALSWLDERSWFFNVIGTAKIERMMRVFEYAARRYKIKNFIVDSLSKCGLDEDDFNGQKRCVEQLCDFKHKHDVHVHLLAHSRKSQSEADRPHKHDVKGSGAITDLVENVVMVWRDKDAERQNVERQAQIGEREFLPTAEIAVEKQRNHQYEGVVPLYYDTVSMRYLERPENALPYVTDATLADEIA